MEDLPINRSAGDMDFLERLGVPSHLVPLVAVEVDDRTDAREAVLWTPVGWTPTSEILPLSALRDAASVGVGIVFDGSAPIDLRWLGDAAAQITSLRCLGTPQLYSGLQVLADMTQLRRLRAPRTDEQIDLSGLVNLEEVSVEGVGLLSALRAPWLRRAFAEVDLLPQGFTFSSSVEEIEFSTNRVDARHLSGHSNLTRVACSDVKEVDFSGLDTAGTWNMLRLIRIGHLSGVCGLAASGPMERVDVEYVKQIESLEDLFALDIGYLYMEGCPQVDARVAHRYARKDRGLVPVRQRGGVRIVRDEEHVELVFDQWAWLSVQLGGSVEDEPPVTSAELEDAFLAALSTELGTEFVSDRVQPDSEGDAVHLVFRQLVDAKRAKKVLDGVLGDAATTLADARGAES